MNEANAALYTTLAGGTALVNLLGGSAVYHQQAPDKTPLPYVVFSKQAGGHANDHGSDAVQLEYFVRGYASTDKQAADIDAAVSALLHRNNITVTGFNTVWCWRNTELESVQTPPNGAPVYMAGAIYSIRIV